MACPLILLKPSAGLGKAASKRVLPVVAPLVIRVRRGLPLNGTLRKISALAALGAPSVAVMAPEAGIRVD